MTTHTLIIIGSGPAGHTAAIYAARANLQPLLFEWWMAGGVAAWGQLTTTTEVENFPGFPTGIMGPVLMQSMRAQSIHAGTDIRTQTITRVDFDRTKYDGLLLVATELQEYLTKSLIISTGATAKKLDVPGVDTYRNKGISGCAVCDGGLPLFRQQLLVIVGGGDVAMEEALYLSKFASSVVILVRSERLRASATMIQRVLDHPLITIMYHTEVVEVLGQNLVTGVSLIDRMTGQISHLSCGGVFFAIGHRPNTDFLKKWSISTNSIINWLPGFKKTDETRLKLDETGYIVTQPGSTQTSVPGVFAAGDVQDKIYRQAITSAGSGCMAALDAEHRLGSY